MSVAATKVRDGSVAWQDDTIEVQEALPQTLLDMLEAYEGKLE